MTPYVKITRQFEWDAMHRIPGHEGKCKSFHGHRYVAEVTVEAASLDALGRVVDFGFLKSEIGKWIDDNFDHTAILWSGDDSPAIKEIISTNKAAGCKAYILANIPTVENIVIELARRASEILASRGVTLSSIRLWETPNCSAVWVSTPDAGERGE